MVVTVVAGLIEIRFYMQNQTLKNNFTAYFPFHKTFSKHFHLKIFYTRKIFYILPNTALK